MKTCFVQLGKAGDCLSALPILQDRFTSTRQPQNLVVSKQYLPLVEGLEGITPITWDGPCWDIQAAIRHAKKSFGRVIVPQTHGDKFSIQHRTPSWQYDQYERAGVLDKWDALPLTLPRNGVNHFPIKSAKAVILVADEGQSCPFPKKDDLWKLLNDSFAASHELVRLSTIKLDRLRDFLPILHSAQALVSIDTSFLHLSKASKIPVFALTTDDPQRWRGAAWSKRFSFYCRYSEFDTRKDELIRSLSLILNRRNPVEISIVPTSPVHGYNPSIIDYGGQTLMTFRYHPEAKNWRTQLRIMEGGNVSDLVLPDEFDGYSIEDARLFIHNEKLHASYVISRYTAHPLRSIVGYGQLVKDGNRWRILKHIQPNHGKNNFTAMEKNWCFFEQGKNLYAIYHSIPQQTILQLNGERVVAEHQSLSPKWDYGEIRGGVVLHYKDNLLRFFHSVTGDRNKLYAFRYHIGAALMEPVPPFRVISITKHPILSGHERWTPSCPHYKANVVFPCGAIPFEDGWKVSIGVNDSLCAVASIKPEHLDL